MKYFTILMLLLAVCALPAQAEPTRTVAAVNAPLAYIASVLGGEAVEVVYPIPPDIDPAYWQPSAEEILRYQQADLILLNGAGYAGWTKTALLPRARLVDTTASVQDRLILAKADAITHKHGPEGDHTHDGAYAFTTWLDPDIATAQVAAVADAMAQRWPDMAPGMADRIESLDAELAALDAAFTQFFSDVAGREIFASHPVYQYLDRAYSGDILALHWEPDEDPGAPEWEALEQALDQDRDPLMLWENTPIAETRARAKALGIDITVLSPMANAMPFTNLFENLARQVAGR